MISPRLSARKRSSSRLLRARSRTLPLPIRPFVALVVATLLALGLIVALAPETDAAPLDDPRRQIFEGVLGWPEEQRAFFQDGPGFLLARAELDELLELDGRSRAEWIEAFYADPIPETPENEMREGVERRRALVRETLRGFQDVRAELLFLHGEPTERMVVDCVEVFKPMELWTYGPLETGQTLVIFQDRREQPWQMWSPFDNKRVLYTEEMAYFLEQWEELKSRITGGNRIDREFCRNASERVDEVTGVDGLFGFEKDRPKDSDFAVWLRPPADRAAWARAAATTRIPEDELLEGGEVAIFFPEREDQRMKTLLQVEIEDPSQLEIFEEGESRQLRLVLDGQLERAGSYFEEFRVRFQIPAPEEGFSGSLALQAERLLRPGQSFLMRLRVTDEITGKRLHLARGFEVAAVPTPTAEVPPVPEEAIVAIGEDLARQRLSGYDSLVLVPPVSDVVFGLWRAEALVTGERIQRVKFFLDDQEIVSRKGPPFSTELRLATYPKEQIVRAEGYDAARELVAADEVVVNQPRGELRVRILEPRRGVRVVGEVDVEVEVVVPEEKKVESVQIKVGENVVATLDRPPWQTRVQIDPAFGQNLTYLTAVAELDDGQRAEDVRFVNSPEYLEEVDVNLVELYTTVMDRGQGLVQGLEADDFRVLEDGRPQRIAKFERVEDLPLTLGVVIDTSGSMYDSLSQAQRAALEFLENIITTRDRCFAVSFSDRPELLMGRTSDVGAIAEQLEYLSADGMTALHDAVVTSLYYYRGVRGRRAMVLLSDGEDTSSTLGFREALEYAKRSGISIYAIGLDIGKLDFSVRNKLDELAEQTGGRTYYIREAEELRGVYAQIEKELRSQYLLAYNSDSTQPKDQYREVEVEVEGGYEARTIRGYYP